jgi:AcrR family transcriptional regulator
MADVTRRKIPDLHDSGTGLRADAARNRARILDAAEQVFGERGTATSTEEVARLAGVGIGTVFRHFPTKEALLEALLRTRLAQLAADADALALDAEGGGFFVFFRRLVEQASKKRAVVQTLAAGGVDVTELMASAGRELRAAVGRLLGRAQQAGLVRKDVGVAEVLGILVGMAHAAEQGGWNKRMQRRTLAVIFDGLRLH